MGLDCTDYRDMVLGMHFGMGLGMDLDKHPVEDYTVKQADCRNKAVFDHIHSVELGDHA